MSNKYEKIKTGIMTALIAIGAVGAFVVFAAPHDGTNMAHAVECARLPCSNVWSGDITGGALGTGPYGNGNWASPTPSTGGLPPNIPHFHP